ncbi:MAG TPA: hypothetical protein VF723_14445 [Pyrinomonadaceae bacterium]|jgi:hypothetical protein
MSASLNQWPSRRKPGAVILITLLLLLVALVSYLILREPLKERLIKHLNSLLREGKFAQLYVEADDLVHLNVTKEQFVQRMKIAVAKLRAIDENLNLQRDRGTESLFLHDNERILITAVQTLEKDGKSVSVCVMWASDTRKFYNLFVMPTLGTSEEYRVLSVSRSEQ